MTASQKWCVHAANINIRRISNIGLILGRRLRRPPNNKPTYFYRISFCQFQDGAVHCLKLPAWKVGDRMLEHLKFQRNKMFLTCSFVNIKYCGKPPWPRSSELDLRPPRFEFCMLCLRGNVMHLFHLTILRSFSWLSFIYNYVHKAGLKPHLFIQNLKDAALFLVLPLRRTFSQNILVDIVVWMTIFEKVK